MYKGRILNTSILSVPVPVDCLVVMRLCCASHDCAMLTFNHPQASVSFMRYISVACVVGIIAGFCIGPGKTFIHLPVLSVYTNEVAEATS